MPNQCVKEGSGRSVLALNAFVQAAVIALATMGLSQPCYRTNKTCWEGTTMHYYPEQGCPRVELHLDSVSIITNLSPKESQPLTAIATSFFDEQKRVACDLKPATASSALTCQLLTDYSSRGHTGSMLVYTGIGLQALSFLMCMILLGNTEKGLQDSTSGVYMGICSAALMLVSGALLISAWSLVTASPAYNDPTRLAVALTGGDPTSSDINDGYLAWSVAGEDDNYRWPIGSLGAGMFAAFEAVFLLVMSCMTARKLDQEAGTAISASLLNGAV